MWEALQALSLQAGAFCWSLVLLLKWLHAQTIQPTGRMVADTLLPIWEESLRASGTRAACACRAGLPLPLVACGERSVAFQARPGLAGSCRGAATADVAAA